MCVQVHEAVDGLTDELHFLQDQVNNVDPIAVIPAEIQDQIAHNRVCILLCSEADFRMFSMNGARQKVSLRRPENVGEQRDIFWSMRASL